MQIGADYQFADRWVAGIFGDYDFSDIKGTVSDFTFGNVSLKQSSAWSLGGRLGYLLTPQILTYFDGGYAQARFTAGAFTDLGVPNGVTMDNLKYAGWFIGGGTEVMIFPNWFVKGEYRLAQYGTQTAPLLNSGGFSETIKPYVQTIRTALVYKFNWGR